MDKKLGMHLQMQMEWMLYQLTKDEAHEALKEVDRYETSHGVDIAEFDDTDGYKDAYCELTETDDGWKQLWHRWNVLFDKQMDYLRSFAATVERFTDGRIDEGTARQMAISKPEDIERVLFLNMEVA